MLKPGDTFIWNGMQVVVKQPYEVSVLCTQVGKAGGVFGIHPSEIPCPECNGTGIVWAYVDEDANCTNCSGTGSYQQVINNVNNHDYGKPESKPLA